jgi:transposase
MQVSTIGVDLAKNVFQVHGVDSAGKIVISRKLRRKQVIDFFSKIPLVWSAWKLAEPLIIGLVKSPSSVTLCV